MDQSGDASCTPVLATFVTASVYPAGTIPLSPAAAAIVQEKKGCLFCTVIGAML